MVTINTKYSNLSELLDSTSGIPSDVTFKIVGDDDDDEVLGEVKGHKVLLAAFSPVFKSMFFGPLKETKDVIKVEQTTLKAFENVIKYIYKPDHDWSSMSLLELYDIVNLAEMYDMPMLSNDIKTQMQKLPLTLDSLMNVAHTATQFSQFEEISSALLLTCSEFLRKAIRRPEDQLQFGADQVGSGREKIVLQLFGLFKNLPPLDCSNCGRSKCLDGEEVDSWDKFSIDLKIKVNKACSRMWGPNGGPYASKSYTVNSRTIGQQQKCSVDVKDSSDLKTTAAWPVEYGGVPTFCYNCV